MIKEDFLPKHPEIRLFQDDTMFMINTDTMVLGEFLNIYRNDIVLDIGTNNGSLLLYASLFTPKMLIGLDINEKALELAERNMQANNITNYQLVLADIISYRGELVDTIICNPPYFKTEADNKANNQFKNLAKHEGTLTLSGLVKSISANLKDNGTLFFLFLASRLEEVMIEMKRNNIAVKEVQFVYDNEKDFSNVFMLRGRKNGKQGLVVRKPIIISRNDS